MEIKELNEGVHIFLNDSNVLEAYECDKQADTCGNSFLKAVRKSFCDILSCSRYREDKEEYTRKKDDAQTLAVTLNGVRTREKRGENE